MPEETPNTSSSWRILVVITGTAEGQRALDLAISLAQPIHAELVALLAEGRLPAYPATTGEIEDERHRQQPFFDTLARLAVDQAAEHGLELEVRRRPGPIVRAVAREASAGRVDLVVVGCPRRRRSLASLPRLTLLARRVRRPILIVP